MASRRNRKHHSRSTQAIFADFEWRRAQDEYERDRKTFRRRGDEVKMSEVLIDFIGPYRRGDESLSELRALVSIGLAAWNLALLPREERETIVQKVADDTAGDGVQDLRRLLGELVERKEKWFSGIQRFILDYDLRMNGDEPYLSVISSMP